MVVVCVIHSNIFNIFPLQMDVVECGVLSTKEIKKKLERKLLLCATMHAALCREQEVGSNTMRVERGFWQSILQVCCCCCYC